MPPLFDSAHFLLCKDKSFHTSVPGYVRHVSVFYLGLYLTMIVANFASYFFNLHPLPSRRHILRLFPILLFFLSAFFPLSEERTPDLSPSF